MEIFYENKKTVLEIFENSPAAKLKIISGRGKSDKLIQGENLSVLKALLKNYSGKVDLIYIDPPFATNNCFKISRADREVVAYKDSLVGEKFLEFLRQRLIFLREFLSPQGSLYIHSDCKIGHYVKLICDEIFGQKNFRNDIARIKCNPKNFYRRAYGNAKDTILFYTKTNNYIFNDIRLPDTENENKFFKKIDQNGRRYTTIALHAPGKIINGSTGREWRSICPPPGRHWRANPKTLDKWNELGLIEWSSNGIPRKKIFRDEIYGKKIQDIWNFKDPQLPQYPTQKNLELLKLIVQTSSHENSLVLDCFCGSGTTLLAARSLNRHWLGIDNSPLAIRVVRKKLTGLSYEFLRQQK